MKWDFIFWLAFAAGQAFFILKRTALAIRSPLNGITSRWQYLKINWDILSIRFALEFLFVFIPYRHVPLDQLTANLPWHLPFHIPQDSAAFCALLGYFSDSFTDWLAMQDKFLGVPIPGWVKETIPQLPQVQQMVDQLKSSDSKR